MKHRPFFQALGLRVLAVGCVMLGLALASASADSEVVILDTYSHWRAHVTLRPMVFGSARDAQPYPEVALPVSGFRGPTLAAGSPTTPRPPADWMQPHFDDSRWWQDPGPFFGGGIYIYGHTALPHHSRYGIDQPLSLSLLCLRGKFAVTDPKKVESLKFSGEFRGGMVVYLNGKEVARRHLPEGKSDFLSLADGYPWEAYVDEEGVFLKRSSKEPNDRLELRVRQVGSIKLPVAELHKGVNVLALEIHRSPMHLKALEMNQRRPRSMSGNSSRIFWNTVSLLEAKLAARGAGIVTNTHRPKGMQVWNTNPLESVLDTDYGDPTEPLRPIRIVGTRGGIFSGQVVVGSPGTLKGMRAEMSNLKQSGGKGIIQAASITIRYPHASIPDPLTKTVFQSRRYGTPAPLRYHGLLESPPTVVKVKELSEKYLETNPSPPWLGAVQPIWLTVPVPTHAPPGNYEGTLTIRLAGEAPVLVPVTLEVHDFRLPEPTHFQTWVDYVQSPESLAAKFELPLWSEAHWKLIRKSLGFMAAMGSRALYLPLICRTNHGNRQSTVHWIKTSDDYEYDFTLVERYLDLALEAGLKPDVVCFQVWDYHIGRDVTTKYGTGLYGQSSVNEPRQVPVSVLDPATGTVQEMLGPKYGTPEAEDFWKPVAERLREITRKRGLEKAVMLGLAGDYIPTREVVQLWDRLLPGAPWICMAHGGLPGLHGVPIGYRTTVFLAHFAVDPQLRRNYGWQNAKLMAYFPRYPRGSTDGSLFPHAYDALLFEKGLQANLLGAGRLALDVFNRPRFLDSNWASLRLPANWLAAGPQGPISTVRFEVGRAGIQECEARIFIEQALADEKLRAGLGQELADRCQALLDERTRTISWADEKTTNNRYHCYLPGGPLGVDWYAGSDWQTRTARLLATATEVAARAKFGDIIPISLPPSLNDAGD